MRFGRINILGVSLLFIAVLSVPLWAETGHGVIQKIGHGSGYEDSLVSKGHNAPVVKESVHKVLEQKKAESHVITHAVEASHEKKKNLSYSKSAGSLHKDSRKEYKSSFSKKSFGHEESSSAGGMMWMIFGVLILIAGVVFVTLKMKGESMRLDVGKKILGGVIVIMVVAVISSLVGIISMNKIGKEIEGIAETDMPLVKMITSIEKHQLGQVIQFERAMRHTGEIGTIKQAKEYFLEADEEFKSLAHQVDEEILTMEKLVSKDLEQAHSLEEKEELEHVLEKLQEIDKEYGLYEEHALEIIGLLKEGHTVEASHKAEELEKEEELVGHAIESLLEEIESFTEKAVLQAEHDEKNAVKLMIVITIIMVILGLFMGVITSKAIANPVKHVITTLTDVEQNNDLTKRFDVNSNDELGDMGKSLNSFLEKLEKTIAQVYQSSQVLNTTVEEVANSSQIISDGAQQQAASFEELSSSVQSNATNAGSANDLAQNASSSLPPIKLRVKLT